MTDGNRRAFVEGLEGRRMMAVGPPPNLNVTGVDYKGQTEVMAGRTVNSTVFVSAPDVRGFRYRMAFYLSRDENFSRSEDRLLRKATFFLGQGGGNPVITIPVDVRSGTYRIIAVADPDNDLEERSEDDNVGVGPELVVTGAVADVAVTARYTGPTRLVSGNLIRPKLTLSNPGTARAKGKGMVSFFLVDEGQTDVSGLTPLNPVPIPVDVDLKAGASEEKEFRFELPAGVTATGKRLAARVSIPGLTEISTDNNTAVAPGAVLSLGPGLADLRAELVGTVPTTLVGSKKNKLKVRVTNAGNVTVNADVLVQLGLESPVGGARTFFKGNEDQQKIEPGKSRTFTLTLPAGQTGTGLLGARVVYGGDSNPANDVNFSETVVTFT